MDRLAGQRRPIGRILRQQAMEQRAATARQPDDEDRPANRLSGDSRVALSLFGQAQPVDQELQRFSPCDEAAEWVERGLESVGIEQNSERLSKRLATEILERSEPAGVFEVPSRQLGSRTGSSPGWRSRSERGIGSGLPAL